MNFNLDLARKALLDFHPITSSGHSRDLGLSRVVVGEIDDNAPPDGQTLVIVSLASLASLLNESTGTLSACSFAVFDEKGLGEKDVYRAFELIGTTPSRAQRPSSQERSQEPGFGAHASSAKPSPQNRARAIVLCNPCSQEQVTQRLSAMRSELNSWSEAILTSLFYAEPLQTVLDKASRLFPNPIMVSDAAMRFVLTAGDIPEGFDDPLWSAAMETGLCPIELYFHEWAESSDDAFERRQAYFVDRTEKGGHRYLFRNLIHENEHYGSFELINACCDFTDSDLALADYLGDLLSRALHNNRYESMTPSHNTPVQTLFFEGSVNEQSLAHVLSAMKWKENDEFYFAIFSFPETPLDTKAINRQIKQRILHRYPRAFLFNHEDGIAVIARPIDYPLNEVRASANGADPLFAPPLVIRHGVSSVQARFSSLATAHEQARAALSMALRSDKRICTVFYDDCFFDDAFERLPKSSRFAFEPPAPLATLIEADERDGTEYIQTILAHLECGCSAARTAEVLQIHRNTLAYRLKRIKALSGIDLERPQDSSVDLLRLFMCCKALARPTS